MESATIYPGSGGSCWISSFFFFSLLLFFQRIERKKERILDERVSVDNWPGEGEKVPKGFQVSFYNSLDVRSIHTRAQTRIHARDTVRLISRQIFRSIARRRQITNDQLNYATFTGLIALITNLTDSLYPPCMKITARYGPR